MDKLANSCLDSFSSGIIKKTAVFSFSIVSNSKSVLLVRLVDGSIDYITILCGHDNIIDCYVGQVINKRKKLFIR